MPREFLRYRHARLLARTEYADVYEAKNNEGRLVALKVLRFEDIETALVDALFARETAALQGFSHDGIVTLVESYREEDGAPVLVFELVPGKQTLDTLLTRAMDGQPSKDVLWRLREAERLVSAVSAAHARKVIHRDLKPANVLYDIDAEVLRICDFGIANVLLHRVLNPGGRTLRDLFTRPYAAPEQCLQGEALYPADVHALSLVLVALLAMQKPSDQFKATDFDVLWNPASEALIEAGANTEAVGTLGTILRGGLHEQPEKRPVLLSLADALGAVRASLTLKPTAAIILTNAAKAKMTALGFDASTLAQDLNRNLALRLDTSDGTQRIKLYGDSVVAVAAVNEEPSRAVLIDLKLLTGPNLNNDRRNAQSADVTVHFGNGDGSALLAAAVEAQGHIQTERVQHLLALAQRVIDLERERLPQIEFRGYIVNGTAAKEKRENRITDAAGYEATNSNRVQVRNARLQIESAIPVLRPDRKTVLGGALQEVESIEPSKVPSLFDNLEAMQVVDPMTKHQIGRVTEWRTENDGTVLATIAFDSERTTGRNVVFHLEDIMSRRLLDKQEEALDRVRVRRTRLSALPELLTLPSAHVQKEREEIVPFHDFLKNDRRVRDIVERVLASPVSAVQGPPGTGKTTLTIELVMQLLKRNPRLRILVCSQANEAVANALEGIQDAKVAGWLNEKPWLVRDVRDDLRNAKRADGLEPMFRAKSAEFVAAATEASKSLPWGAGRTAITEWKRDLEHAAADTLEEFACHVQVWGATTARSQRTLAQAQGEAWDVVIVDEAAKITLAEVLVPLVDAAKIVLVGDHKQLPPFLDSVTAEQLDQLGLDPDDAKLSLFQHLFETVLPADQRGEMVTQSRMHPTIGSIVSKLFYEKSEASGRPGKKLLHNVKPDQRPLPAGRFNRDHRVLFLGYRGQDVQTPGGSRKNVKEAGEVGRVLKALDAEAAAKGQSLTVSIITPYKSQAKELETVAGQQWKALKEVRAGTVHSFQGRQSDVVLYSLVRTGATEWRFLADPRLFNVAMSRARSLFVLVGDLDGAPSTPLMKELLDELPTENKLPIDTFLSNVNPEVRSA